MATPTKEEIKVAIEQLKELKPKVRRQTFFGDDNHEAIDAQIWVLETEADEDEIWDKYPDDEDDMRVRDNALLAWGWLNDQPPEDGLSDNWLVEQWGELVQD